MFRVTGGKGFQIKFENGWTVSVKWGVGNYCDHHGSLWDLNRDAYVGAAGSTTAEIAAFDANKKFYDFEGGETVKGWATPAEVAEFISFVASM